MKKLILLALAGFCLQANFATAQGKKCDYERADTLSKINGYFYSKGVKPTWIEGTSTFWYLNHERWGDRFYLVDAAKKEKKPAFNADSLAVRLSKVSGNKVDANRLPFTTISIPDNLQSISFDYDGSPWKYTITTNTLERLPNPPTCSTPKSDRVASPDGKWQAYIKDFNLFIFNLSEKKEIRLSEDGVSGSYYGTEIFWSPDSRKIATTKVRDVTERKIPLVESSPASQRQPILKWIDYAKPGDPLPIYSPALFDVEGKKQIPIDVQPYANQFYLSLTGWRKDSRAFTFEFNQRGHQAYQVAEADASTGKVKTLVNEQSNTFIEYYKSYRYDLNDGREMLWISNRDGWRHIYLIDCATGKAKQLTKGEWVVRNVVNVDEAKKTILFTASGINKGEDPYHIHYYSVGFDGRNLTNLTPERANHTATFCKDYTYMVDVYSRPDTVPVSVLRNATNGKVTMMLEQGDISEVVKKGWQMPEVFSAKGRDGKTDIWGTILRPYNFDAGKSYPVVEMIYAGPHDSHVPKDFSVYHHLCSRLSDLGFVVVLIDGMGTGNRSKAFHDVCWKNLKDAGFPDRIAWIKAAATKYPYMDTTRVGIYGWSAGGQNAMAALLFHNNFYKAAVALCGCHDNRMDKIWWNEQWMGYPIDESYSQCSNVDNAWRLKGKLLLINGELDDNVDPASTLQVVSALIKANKNFEQLYLPGFSHNLGAPFVMHKIHDFFVKSLLNQTPPEW